MLAAQLSGNKKAEADAVTDLNAIQERTRKLDSGLFGAGTIYNSPTEKLNPTETAKRFAPAYVGAVGETFPLPATKAISGANLGIKAAKVGLASGAANVAADTGSQLMENGKVDLKRTATAFGTGIGLGVAAPVLGAAGRHVITGAKPVIRKAGELVPPPPVVGAPALQTASPGNTFKFKAPSLEIQTPEVRVDSPQGPVFKNPFPDINPAPIENQPFNFSRPKIQALEPKAKTNGKFVQPEGPIPTNVTNADTLIGQVKKQFVDKEAPYIDFLKKYGTKEQLDQFYLDSGVQTRSNAVANQTVLHSEPLKQALFGLEGDAKKQFDQYTAARAELNNVNRGLKTGSTKQELEQVIKALGPENEARHKALTQFYQDYADRLYETGHITKKKYDFFKSNKDYTRIQREMEDLAGYQGQGGNSYSFGQSLTSQKRKGSSREIQPADITAFKYAQDVEKEIARNQSATNIIDTLQTLGLTKKISAERAANKNVIKRRVNGTVEHWEVPRDIKEIADNVTPFQLGVLGRIVSAPQRLLRAGATGLSAPFTAANYVKDQASSGVFSKSVRDTHHPKNIAMGLKDSIGDFAGVTDDPLWNKFTEHLGDTTQYDFIRNQKSAKDLSREIRLGGTGKAANMVKHPIRTLEDLNQITEKATRFQNFKGIYEKTIKAGGSEADATRAATIAAWQNSVDFSRMGETAQVVNLLIPYFNAGIQGTRTMGRAFKERPVATSMKTVGAIGLPLMGITLYNNADENRKKIYDNISDYEKENNLVIVLPNAKQLPDGSYEGVIKVPLQPGLTNLVQPIRIGVENFVNKEPADVAAMTKQFLGAATGPINTANKGAAMGSLIPQWVKPAVQQGMNKDLFTGKDIVADYVNEATDANGNPIPESKKAYDFTSGSSRFIGDKIGVSPIRIDKFIKDTSGKVGQYSQNAVDNALAKKGVIGKDQIGGVSVGSDFTRRFARAQGKENFMKSEGSKHFDDVKKITANMNVNEKNAFNALHPNKKNFLGDVISDIDSTYNPAARLDAYNRFPKVFEADKQIDAKGRKKGNPGNPLFDLEPWQVKKVLEKENLPPGATDKELSKLHDQEWYDDYSNKKQQFFTAIKDKTAADLEAAKKKGDKKAVASLQQNVDKFNSSDNPYPVTSPELQAAMNGYSKLPKGTGARKAWIQGNPGIYKQMTDQYAAIDNWQNKQRGKRGLDTTEGDAGKVAGYDTGSSSGGYGKAGYSKSGGGSGGGSSSTYGTNNPYEYAIKLKAGGKAAKPTIKQPTKGKAKIAKKSVGKPKVTSKKSLV